MTTLRTSGQSQTEHSRPLEGEAHMTEWVRGTDPNTGHLVSMSKEQADLVGLKQTRDEAEDAQGKPLPPKYKTSVNDTKKGDA